MSFEGQPSIDHSTFHAPDSSLSDESSENNSDPVNTENIDELDSGVKPKEPRRKQDQFNQAVNNQLDKEFAENHDVGGLYFTHAFPSANLEGIIAQGGLRTPAQLQKRGNTFVTGSNASYAGRIFFSKREIYTGYSTYKEERKRRADESVSGQINEPESQTELGGSAILVPQIEFDRMRRFRKNTEGSRGGLGGYNKDDFNTTKRGGEYALISEESSDGDPNVDMAKKLADALKAKKNTEIEIPHEQKMTQLRTDFEQQVAGLPIEGFAKDADSVLYTQEIKKRMEEIPKLVVELEAKVTEAGKKLGDIHKKILDQEEFVQRQEEQSLEEITRLEPTGLAKFLEKFGIGKRVREQKTQVIQNRINKNRSELDQLIAEQLAEDTKKENAKNQISTLQLYEKLCGEFFTLVENSKRDLAAEKEKLEDKYRTDTFSSSSADKPLGTQTQALHERLRKSNETEDTEDKFRVGLAHSIILIDRGQMEKALKSTEDKPDLRSRILVYDPSVVMDEYNKRDLGNDAFETGNKVLNSEDSLNAVQQLLCRTEDGMDILKTTQGGAPITEKFKVAGIKRLDEYV